MTVTGAPGPGGGGGGGGGLRGGGGGAGGAGGLGGGAGGAGGLGGGAKHSVSSLKGLITPAPSWPALLLLVLEESMLVAVSSMQLR